MVSIGLDNEDEIDAILAFANSAPTYREDALEIIQTLSARESRGRS